MKKLALTASVWMLMGSFFAQKEVKVESKIDQVTVFLQGAQIKERARFTVEKGVSKVIFEGMSPHFDKNSIQVKGKGDFIILDVMSRVHYPQPEKEKPSTIPTTVVKELKLLNDSIETLVWQIKEIENDLSAFNLEKNLLLNSGVVKAQSTKDSMAALKVALEYVRVKLPEINKNILKTERRKYDAQNQMSRMQNRKAELENFTLKSGFNYVSPQPINQIVVSVSSDIAATGYLDLSYMVAQAGWSPSYDLRADDITSPVKLTYKANVFQSTGVEWKDVKIKLSTINPNRSNVKPVLAPWYLSYYQPIQPTSGAVVRQELQKTYATNAYAGPQSSVVDYAVYDEMNEASHVANYTAMSENLTMVEFDLKIPYTIASNGQPYLMAIKSENIKTTYEYFVVPKLDPDAYLIAYLTGWEEMNLLPAVANIYYDGTYVGQTRINPAIMSDKLELPMGRDNGIVVTRKKIKDEEKTKTLSSEKTKMLTYEIAVRNMKAIGIKIVVEDQIPLSKLDDVKVEMADIGKAEHIAETGKIRWIFEIPSKETRKATFSYNLKFDKERTLAAY
jgi:uncharacterized protein (TIGR02231 family)